MGQTRRNFLKLAGAAGIGAAAAPRAFGAAQGKARTVAARGNGWPGPLLPLPLRPGSGSPY